jgi:hypothetical protein
MLYYGNELVFRTIPDTTYIVNIYGYKRVGDYSGNAVGDEPYDGTSDNLPFDHWLRYVAYGAALEYAMDYSIDPTRIQIISKTYARHRELVLTRTHNQIKISRCVPRF